MSVLSSLLGQILGGLAVIGAVLVGLWSIRRDGIKAGESAERAKQAERDAAGRVRVEDVLSKAPGSTGEYVDRYRKDGRL